MLDTLVSHPFLVLKGSILLIMYNCYNSFYSEMNDLHGLALAFLDRFPMMYSNTKAMSIIIVNFEGAEVLHRLTKTIRTCSTSYTRSIHVNVLGVGTHNTCIYSHHGQK